MIKSIYLDNFRHFKDFTVNFHHPYTLLCGLNGTGKSAVLEVISRLQAFILNDIQIDDLCLWSDTPAWGGGEALVCETKICFEIEKNGTHYFYSLLILADIKTGKISIGSESLRVDNQLIFESNNGTVLALFTDELYSVSYPTDLSLTGLSLAERSSSKIRDFLRHVKSSIFSLSINPYLKSVLIPIGPGQHNNEPTLFFDASNFVAWYNFLMDRNISEIAEAFGDFHHFIPGFRQFSFVTIGNSKELMANIVADTKHKIAFDSLSHGQKILVILHLLVRVAPENSTIAIDEIENFLAPTELQPLFDAFQDAYEERNIQFILVSHHPKTLHWFADSAIIFSFSGNPPRLINHEFDEADEVSIIDFLSESVAANEL